MSEQKNTGIHPAEEKPFLSVVVHSFFIIPFLIAVFALLLFAAVNLLTREQKSVYDYLNDVKVGALNKRWQGAFELSKILSNPKIVPKEERFIAEMIAAFEGATHDDDRVRQYLALAMGRSGIKKFTSPLSQSLKTDKEDNIPALLYGLGMLRNPDSIETIAQFIDHPMPRIRSTAVAALGNMHSEKSVQYLQKGLNDSEPNVQWGAAISLAQIQNNSGKSILINLLDRKYLSTFKEVDADEQNNLILMALESSQKILDQNLKDKIELVASSDPNMHIRSEAMKILK